MGFRGLVGTPISEGSRLGPDYSSHGERDVRGLDVESYIGLSCGPLRKCGNPSDCISRRRSIVHLSDEPMSCPFPTNCSCSTCRLTLIPGGWSAIRNVWSAALPQAKSDVTGWSAQMYTAFVGVNHSWPGWNALRSFPH